MSRMETYSASISLGEESAQMWSLNKRLEAYLSRVKALEEENELLRAEIHHLKSTKSDQSVVRKYHDEIMKLRDALDDGHREMVQVETDRDSIYQEIEYVKELCLQEKQAQEDVKKELFESKKLLEEEKRAQIWLKERLIQLEQEMEDILKTHEEEKALMEEEISSYSQRLENFKIAPTNFQPVHVEDYAIKMSQIWQGAVEEYKNEVSVLEANLSQAKEKLKKVLDENKQSQLQLQNLDRELQNLKDRKEMLEELLAKQWLEQQDEEGRLQLEIETLEKEKQDLRVQIAQVLEDRQQLMHLKMSLSLEVATYRSLLEAESTRIYTPSTDYKISSSFNDSVLEQNTFRKSRHESTKPLISRDSRLKANKKQSLDASSTSRYVNVKSTSISNRASPVTKEFQKVSSVLQSQGLNYTKAPSAKAATTLPPVERNLERHLQNGDALKKSKVETVSYSYSRDTSKPVTKETVRKDTDIRPVLNGSAYNTTDLGLKKADHIGEAEVEFLLPGEEEIVSAQVESSLKTERKHIEVISDFVLEEPQHFVEAENKDNDTLVVEKPHTERIDFEVPLANDDRSGKGFGNIEEEEIIEKQEVIRQVVSCQRVYGEKEELVEPQEFLNMETSIKVNDEELRKVLDFSKPNEQDTDEPNVLSSDSVSDQGIQYSLSQELDFETQVSLSKADVDNASQDKDDITQGVDEEKESLQLNKVLEFSHTEEASNYLEAEADLQDEEVTVHQKLQVLSSPKEDSNQLLDDGQNFAKDIRDEEMEEYHENPEKDTKIPQDTNIQEFNDDELDQQSSREDKDILEAEQHSYGKQEYTQVDQERQEGFDASEGHLSNEEDFKTEIKKEDGESYEEEHEENLTYAEQNISDSNEKNNLEFSDSEQNIQSCDDQQRSDIVETPEEITQEFSDANQKDSEDQSKEVFDQMDNVQKEVSQLSEDVLDSPQPGLEDLKNVDLRDTEQEGQQIGEGFVESEQVVQTLDSEEVDSLPDVHADSKQEELHDIVQEETVVSNEEDKDLQEIKQSEVELQSVQSTPEHKMQLSEGEVESDGQSVENVLIEEERDIKMSTVELGSELMVGDENKEDVSEENYEVYTEVEDIKSIKTEVVAESIHEKCESYEEDSVKEYKENEDDQLVQKESDVELNIAMEDESLIKQMTEPIVEGQSEVSTDIEQDIAKLDDVLQDSKVDEDQPSDKETIFQHESEDLVQADGEKDLEESSEVVLATDEYTLSKEDETEQSIEEDHDIVEDSQEKPEQDSQFLENETNVKLDEVTENEPEVKSSFYQEVEEGQEGFHQEVEEGQEGYHQEVEERKESYQQEVEEGQVGYHQEVEGQETCHQEVEEGKEDYNQEVEEGQAGYHKEVEHENVASEEDNKTNQSFQNDSDDQYMGFSLSIIPNNLRFTSESDVEAQPEQQEQSNELSNEGTETCEDEIVQEEGFENVKQNNDDLNLEGKDIIEKEQEIFESEIICQQSAFPLEHERETLFLEDSKSHVVFAEIPAEQSNIDGPTEKQLTEFDEAASCPENENSKSEESIDSQDISIYSQKSEEFEISKDYQLEQTLPDTTPLPNLDDEFEDLADDEVILASKQSVEVTKECPVDDGEAEEVLDSSLESQSSQILAEVTEQSNLIEDDDKVSDYKGQQDESTKDLLDSEQPEHFVAPKIDTEDSAILDTEEYAAELSEEPVDSKMDDELSEEYTASQETVYTQKVDEFEASKDSQLEKPQFEVPPPEDHVQFSSEQLVSESVDEDHKEEPEEKSLGEDTENVLTQTVDFVPSAELSETELAPSQAYEETTENEDYIIKEQSDLVTQDFGLEQTEGVDTEDHERDLSKEEDKEFDVDFTDDVAKEPSTESLDEFNGENIISSNVPDVPNEESEVQDGVTLETNQEDVEVDVKPSEEMSENDDSVTSDDSSPNVSTISYAPEQEDSKTQCSEKGDISGETDSKSPKELEQNEPLLTPELVPEENVMEQIEPQESSEEEKHILGVRSDSLFDSNKEHEEMSEIMRECSEDGKTVNGIYGHTIVQATLDLDDHMFNGHSTGESGEIIISEAKTVVRLDGDEVNSQSQDKIEDSVIEFTMSEGKSEGLFQSLLETSELKESLLDEGSEFKNIIQDAVKYVDSAAEQSHYTKKIINPYVSERDLDAPSEITSSVMEEDAVNTKQEVNETNQGLKIHQEQEAAWSSDE